MTEAMKTNHESHRALHHAVLIANKALNIVIVAILAAMLAFGCYDWWDAHSVDEGASASLWRPYKPLGMATLGFDELRQVNPDVVGWLELYGTGVDYPVCYSEDQGYYLGHDAKGEPSMTGSVFLDRRSSPDFSDFITLVYGHHMQSDRMFGPLTNFEQAAYFEDHEYGNLHSQDGDNGLDVFACVQADAYDTTLYRASRQTPDERDEQVRAWKRQTVNDREVSLDSDSRVLVMSTCSDAKTNARTVLLAKVCDEVFEDPYAAEANNGTGVDAVLRLFGLPWYAWVALISFLGLGSAALITGGRRRSAAGGAEGLAGAEVPVGVEAAVGAEPGIERAAGDEVADDARRNALSASSAFPDRGRGARGEGGR